MILSWIWVYRATQLLKYRWHLSRNFYRRCQDSKTVQQAHLHWLASSFVQFSPFRNGIQNFPRGYIWGYRISWGYFVQGYGILCAGIQKPGDAKYPMTPALSGGPLTLGARSKLPLFLPPPTCRRHCKYTQPSSLCAFTISKTHIVAKTLRGRQLNAKVYGTFFVFFFCSDHLSNNDNRKRLRHSPWLLISVLRTLTPVTDVYGTPCRVWLVNIARSAWRRGSRSAFLLASFPGLPRFRSSVCVQYNTRFLLGTGRMPHPVGGAMGVTLCLPWKGFESH